MTGIRTHADILARCRLDEETGCYVWAMSSRKGTGATWLPALGKVVSLPYALQWLRDGTTPTNKRRLVPTCGNALCCTPEHRRFGTRSALIAAVTGPHDPIHRARIAAAQRARSTKCSPEIVALIRSSTEPASKLAPKLGLNHTFVSAIRRGEKWATTMPGSSVFAPR